MIVLLAHQGGWDEILFVLAPLILFAILLLIARRRVDQMDSEDNGQDREQGETLDTDSAPDPTER